MKYYLGCPMWANRDWLGSLFSKSRKGEALLSQYAQVFSTVEGNTTFYALPKKSTVIQWNENTPEHFRFTFKLPKTVTHGSRLRGHPDLQHFFNVLKPLSEKLGQVWIQLPPQFTLTNLSQLNALMAELPTEFKYAIEVRNLSFYDAGVGEQRWQDWLLENQVNWVHFDTQALFALGADVHSSVDESVLEAQKVKPAMPERFVATAGFPLLRFIAGNSIIESESRLTYVVQKVAEWIEEGLHPYVMIHTPDCVQAPQVARRFHELLSELVALPTMPAWQGESDVPPQMSLF